jgi:hypothetical protein
LLIFSQGAGNVEAAEETWEEITAKRRRAYDLTACTVTVETEFFSGHMRHVARRATFTVIH